MCSRCADLEEEVAYYKALLGEQEDLARIEDLRLRLRLSPQAVRVLDRLYGARGRLVAFATLRDALSGDGDEISDKHLFVLITAIRKALGGRYAVETVERAGYRLANVGIGRVTQVLTDVSWADKYQFDRRRPRKGRPITDDMVREIRASDEPQRVIATRLGINNGTVWHIRKYLRYADVPDVAPITHSLNPKGEP